MRQFVPVSKRHLQGGGQASPKCGLRPLPAQVWFDRAVGLSGRRHLPEQFRPPAGTSWPWVASWCEGPPGARLWPPRPSPAQTRSPFSSEGGERAGFISHFVFFPINKAL